MFNVSITGRIFYGIAIAVIGLLAFYYRVPPYIVTLPDHLPKPDLIIPALVWGALFTFTGVSIVLKKWARLISLLFGGGLLLLFCFYYIPYELLASPNYMHLYDWENAEKELALAAGALVIAGCFSARNEKPLTRFLAKLIPLGVILFSITMISFGILHFILAKDAATLVPAWIPGHLFWIYFCGAALIGSGIAIIFKIKMGPIATLLGVMIFIWFIVLHIPRVVAAPATDFGDELFSAFLAFAYSGTAFVIAGTKKSL